MVLKEELMEPQCAIFHFWRTPILWPCTLARSTLDMSFCKCGMTERTNHPNIDLVLYDAGNIHRAPHNQGLALIRVVLRLKPYLEWCLFMIQGGDDAIKWIINLKESTGRLARWPLRLSEFELDEAYYAGIKHQATDAL